MENEDNIIREPLVHPRRHGRLLSQGKTVSVLEDHNVLKIWKVPYQRQTLIHPMVNNLDYCSSKAKQKSSTETTIQCVFSRAEKIEKMSKKIKFLHQLLWLCAVCLVSKYYTDIRTKAPVFITHYDHIHMNVISSSSSSSLQSHSYLRQHSLHHPLFFHHLHFECLSSPYLHHPPPVLISSLLFLLLIIIYAIHLGINEGCGSYF